MAHSREITNIDATRSNAVEDLKLTVSSASSLPRTSFFHESSKTFVVLRTSGLTLRTEVAERSRSPRWEKEFNLRGDDSTVMKVELHVLRRFGFSRSEQLVGAAEVRFEEIREKQRQAHEEDIDFITFDLPLACSELSGPQPVLSLRVHRGSAPPKPILHTAQALVSSARNDIQMMKTGPTLPGTPTGVSDIGSTAQNAAKAVGSAKEVKALYESALASVEVFVKMVDAFADIHPYAKAAWTVLSAGYKVAIIQKERDSALSELLESMSTALDFICRFDKTALHEDDKRVILQVAKKTNECALFIEKYCITKSFALRAAKGIFSSDGDEIVRFKNDFDLLRKNMDTSAILSLTEGLSGVNRDLYNIGEDMKGIARDVDRTALAVDRTAQMAILDRLPYAAGASWCPESGCFSDTREALLEEIMNWIRETSASSGAEILCLTGVAGSGKSAIAHTIARRCYEEGILASSFFFNREFEERSRPDKLLSTMTRDLARHPDIRNQISSVLEADQSLATASLSRQFTPLIVEPCRRHTFDNPAVFVLDALDEVSNTHDVLKIFRDDFPKLPRAFRLFTTSRDIPDLDMYLSRSAHVCMRTIDLDAGVNLDDLRIYILWRFGEVAQKLGLGPSWPDQGLKDMVVSKAQGLFQWAVAVFQALEYAYDPTAVLEALLAGLQTGLSPEAKMDEIYTKVLQAYSWNDLGFRRDYTLLIGSILAAKIPLSASALQTLHPEIPSVHKLLSRLGALLTGWRDPNQPVRILHLSLRDFLTARASDSAPFHIHEKDHNRRLGLLCLAFLNENLKPDTPGTGYLQLDSPGIPVVSKQKVLEVLWYACEFWAAHVLEFEAPAPPELFELLRNFLSTRLISWLEVCTSVGMFKGTQHVKTWIQRVFPEDIGLLNDDLNRRLGSALINVSERLSYMDRREEALLAIQEAVGLRRMIEGEPTSVKKDLASSLHNLSIRLSDVGRREDALAVSREAAELRRQLAEDHPAEFNPDLAQSLNSLSICLSSLGQREDALAAVREAVDLYRQLARDRPAAFTPDLAISLSVFSNCLSDLGQREDALAAVREAVDLHRQLAQDRPAAFSHNLALSLNNLSCRLSDLGQQEDALTATREAVDLYRRLARDRPAAFNADLALSLHNLSVDLSALHRREEALAAVKEAVELRRPLAKEIPAVFQSDFVGSLRHLSWILQMLGQKDDAVAAEQEADVLDSPGAPSA
ncbi:hypothetical protein BOTBODRAFT_30791 [Botryobasidium botryosum FD-172 SS1]|uniref:C2 domain-containing protein n=1 Tax=Botryobasidium botryosum (strain FD-172 SS1) TaxID=930990 RepID=A0A067MLP6_BOTB1|nr:hypothetical protein BOTBODRAFT_30791 [Botryobasidium botryosum FD-172 SS1]